MKTIFVITPYLPYPNVGHAGGKAIYDFIVELKKRGFKVCLASLTWPEESHELAHLKQLCEDTYFLITVPVLTDSFFNSLESHPFRSLPGILPGIFRHLAIRRRLNSGIRDMIRRHEPDAVQVEYSTMVLYLKKIRSVRLRVVHLHDLMMKPYERLWLAEKKSLPRMFRYLFFVILKYMELSFCRTFDKVLVKSEYDRNLLLKCGKFRTQIFPLGVHPVAGIAPLNDRERRSVLFVGAMYRDVNEKAALYFIEQIMPRLEENVGAVKFYVVGPGPSPRLKTLSSEKIIVTGFVEDISLVYRRCHVFVAPLFVGGGMIFKVLQSMSFGLPVVSSTVANEGIMARDGEEILIADDAEEFSRRVASLMQDNELWERTSSRGREFVNARYSWDLVIEEYLRKMDFC